MTKVNGELQLFGNSKYFQLNVRDCPYCGGWHPHGQQEGIRQSPCTYAIDGVIKQGGQYDLQINWQNPINAALKDRYEEVER